MAKRKRRVVRRRRRKNPVRRRRVVRRRRRRNPRGVPGSGSLKNLAKQVAAMQRGKKYKKSKSRKYKKSKGKRRRKAVIAYRPTRRRRKWKTRRFTGKGWHDDAGGHKKASRHGWTRRRKGKRGRKFYVTSKGRKYRRPKGKRTRRGTFKMWNPKGGIRTRNPNGMMDVAMPVLLGIAGFLGAAVLVTTLGKYVPDSMKQWAPAAIPIALGLAAMFLAPKYLPKFSKISYGLGFGLLMAGGISLMSQVLPANVKAMIGLSPSAVAATDAAGKPLAGYMYRRDGGVGSFTLAPSMSGYVPRPGAGIGSGYNLSAPLESRYRRTLGANTVVAPGQFAPGGVPTQISTGYETVGMKPYGLGLPMESRRYNNYSWIGVYDKGVYE